ncbi:hypothetical protein CRG98_029015 [Punica granatum]|uniref:Uncharacterized protein n=1 Tax=Punica granatum TaxID=22663 RepID=A0A2I0J2W7_PUNGR|nr:hypothetical protein CRG98_029015 [Punica granatum]
MDGGKSRPTMEAETKVEGGYNGRKKPSMQRKNDYLQSVKAIADELALAGASITSDDVTIHVLNNIGPEFKELAAAIRAREQPIEFELYDKLTDYELFLQRESSHTDSQLITTNLSQKKGRANDKFRKNRQNHGNNYNSERGSSPWPENAGRQDQPSQGRKNNHNGIKCQICDRFGHTATQCFRLRSNYPSPSANYALSSDFLSSKWIIDSGASHHVTKNLGKLSIHSEYSGSQYGGSAHARPE